MSDPSDEFEREPFGVKFRSASTGKTEHMYTFIMCMYLSLVLIITMGNRSYNYLEEIFTPSVREYFFKIVRCIFKCDG